MKLVYHAGALGDFITALPAIDAWRGSQPTVLLGKPSYAPLAATPFDAVWDAGSAALAPLYSPMTGPAQPVCRLLAGIDAALVFSAAASPLAGNLHRSGVREVLRLDPFPSGRVSVIDSHLSAVGATPGSEPRVSMPVQPPFAVEPGTAAIAPGSGSPEKNWPSERFGELACLLQEAGMCVVWIIGPAEKKTVRSADLRAGRRVWESLPLPSLAAALSRCRIYAGNDSGVTHLAAACGCPTVALFGASDPVVWSPRGRRVRVVTSPGEGMRGIAVRDVGNACLDLLAAL